MSQVDNSSEDRRRLARLWMEAQPSVLAYICAAVRRFHDAEDVLQQVAEDVAGHFDQYDESRPFVAWALGIARHRIADFYRTRRDAVRLSDAALVALADAHVRQSHAVRPMHAALEECVEQLTDRARQLLRLRYEQELPSEQIATEIESTAKSVRVTLGRIRNQLAACIRAKLEGATR